MTIAKCIVLFHRIDCNTARTSRPKAGRKDDLINHVMLLLQDDNIYRDFSVSLDTNLNHNYKFTYIIKKNDPSLFLIVRN